MINLRKMRKDLYKVDELLDQVHNDKTRDVAGRQVKIRTAGLIVQRLLIELERNQIVEDLDHN